MSDPANDLSGKVALVTGAGRGIGRSHALALAAAGARVVVNDLGGSDRGEGADQSLAAAVVHEIEAAGGKAVADSGSVADWDSAGRIVNTALSAFGRLDIVVNNAGISRFAGIDVMTRDDWDLTLAVNLTGTAAISHWAAAHWRAAGPAHGRAIINTSSPAGTNPMPSNASYCATKAAVAAFTISIADELAGLGVKVNAIAPIARTRMTDTVPMFSEVMNRRDGDFDPAAPDNVSPLIVYLASAKCTFTGRVFGIDGSDLYLFNGWSAEQHFGNGAKPWTVDGLASALRDADPQDHGKFIGPAMYQAGFTPSNEALSALETIAQEIV